MAMANCTPVPREKLLSRIRAVRLMREAVAGRAKASGLIRDLKTCLALLQASVLHSESIPGKMPSDTRWGDRDVDRAVLSERPGGPGVEKRNATTVASLEQIGTLSNQEKLALDEVVAGLRQLYGARLRSVILYGSKARGNAGEESDIDLLAIVDGITNRFQERRRINEVVVPVGLKYGVLISVLPVEAEFYESVKIHPFYRNVRAEGIAL